MDRGAWWAAAHGVAKSWTRLRHEHMNKCSSAGTMITIVNINEDEKNAWTIRHSVSTNIYIYIVLTECGIVHAFFLPNPHLEHCEEVILSSPFYRQGN